MDYPNIFRVRQIFERTRVTDVPAEVHSQLGRLDIGTRVRPGQRIAITAGSRGVVNINLIIKAVADFCKSLQAQPFIVAAMGSHGGGTSEGQRRILADYGITEAFCGCPALTHMATEIIDHTAEGIPVHFSRDALQAHHVLVVGRIKLHTELVGGAQSGLQKMMLIGLGKHEGAKIYHRAFLDYSFEQIVRQVANRVMAKGRILAGLAIIENAYDETALIEAVPAQEIQAREPELLKLSRRWMPRLPFDRADVLLVDEIGKEISGCGMDTNVVGRKFHEHCAADDEFPKVKRIVIRSLSNQTHGNATGLGKAEFCLSRVVQAMDKQVTWINTSTSGHPSVGMIPAYYDTDGEVLEVALSTVGLVPPPRARLLWIRNTLDLVEVECGQAYWEEAKQRRDLQVLCDPRPLPFDTAGNLPGNMKNLDGY